MVTYHLSFQQSLIYIHSMHEKNVRYNEYLKFLKLLKISEEPSLSEISQVVTYRDFLLEQIKNYIKELDKIDQLIFTELENRISTADDKDKARVDFQHFCNGFRRCIPFENLREAWIPKRIEKHVNVDNDFYSFIEDSTKRKQEILNVIIPLFEKFMHLESFLYFYETGKPIDEGFPDDPRPNQFRMDLEKKGHENEPLRKQFISEANHFLNERINSGKSRSDYITKNDWPTVKFYRDPFRSSDIPESTRKYWIKQAVSNGEI